MAAEEIRDNAPGVSLWTSSVDSWCPGTHRRDATIVGAIMSRYLITGISGSLGRALLANLLADPTTERIVGLSRDEVKQAEL